MSRYSVSRENVEIGKKYLQSVAHADSKPDVTDHVKMAAFVQATRQKLREEFCLNYEEIDTAFYETGKEAKARLRGKGMGLILDLMEVQDAEGNLQDYGDLVSSLSCVNEYGPIAIKKVHEAIELLGKEAQTDSQRVFLQRMQDFTVLIEEIRDKYGDAFESMKTFLLSLPNPRPRPQR